MPPGFAKASGLFTVIIRTILGLSKTSKTAVFRDVGYNWQIVR